MPCPTEDLLVELMEGRIEQDELLGLCEHVDTCVDCRALVAELARVTDTQLGRAVALKLLPPTDDAANALLEARLLREG